MSPTITLRRLEGCVVWLRGIGNAARSRESVLQATVIRVARVNVALLMHGQGDRPRQFRHSQHSDGRIYLHEDTNSGYEVFASWEAYSDRMELDSLVSKIVNEARFMGKVTTLGLAEARKISDLLNGNVDDELLKAKALLNKHGICVDCGEMISHDIVEPFASCKCRQYEWHNLTPYMQLEKTIHGLKVDHNLYEE